MSKDIRRDLIGKNLGIKPINHGQIYTFQIALPDARKRPFSLERRKAIESSLLTHQSNLLSLVVRRTSAYSDEDIEYELVYGADWLQIAQELEIEKMWAWVFDMTDEQVASAIDAMEVLTGTAETAQISTSSASNTDNEMINLIDEKLQMTAESIRNTVSSLIAGIKKDLDDGLKSLNYKIEHFSNEESNPKVLEEILNKINTIEQRASVSQIRRIAPIENSIDLSTASSRDIEVALKQLNTQEKSINAAIKAVQYWKNEAQQLTWENLAISAKANTGSKYKIAGFAQGTYDRLRAVAKIPGKDM